MMSPAELMATVTNLEAPVVTGVSIEEWGSLDVAMYDAVLRIECSNYPPMWVSVQGPEVRPWGDAMGRWGWHGGDYGEMFLLAHVRDAALIALAALCEAS